MVWSTFALMQHTIVCNGCDERSTAAATAMRHHATVMHEAIEDAKAEALTDELRKDYTEKLWASFNDAQLAWDEYRSHLAEHGFLPARGVA